ncbi:MAG: carboxypeptidase regulatory-like domain-containing protein [Longimicrobiales bacterium]
MIRSLHEQCARASAAFASRSARFRATGLVTARTMAIVAIGLLTIPGQSDGQILRGRVLDGTTRGPLSGAHVLLLDAMGARAGRALTRDDGTFTINARTAGSYTVRVELIGRRTLDAAGVQLTENETRELVLELTPEPIQLSGLEVEAEQQCEVRPTAGKLTHTVWEEARKALELEAAVRAEGLYRFSIQRYERETDVSRRHIVSQHVEHINRFTGDPFAVRDIDLLIDQGFFEVRDGVNLLYGPNADVLLADRFLDSHCFFLRRDKDHPAQIGLAFEPVRGRRVPDIEGTLWLEEASAQLRSLEFAFVRLPSNVARGPKGGHAEFHRLPNGAFIIREWAIHSPLVRLERSGVGEFAVQEPRLYGFHEEGAEVLSIADRSGTTVGEARLAEITGVVWDSTVNAPLAGANVYLVGTNVGATTGANGRYRIPNIGPGTYEISFRHERTERYAFIADPVQVQLARGDAIEVDFAIPSRVAPTLTFEEAARLDSIASVGRSLGVDWDSRLERPRDAAGQRGVGRIIGKVVDDATGNPIAGAVVELEGTSFSLQTDENGEFRFDSVPAGPYTLAIEMPGYIRQTNPLEVVRGRILEATLRIAPTGTRGRAG